jgi:hypothetical protein
VQGLKIAFVLGMPATFFSKILQMQIEAKSSASYFVETLLAENSSSSGSF